ncbi:hypothetical protein ACQ4PT_059820 [Festuca glaucescens]
MATAHLSPALAVSSPRRLTCNLSQSPVSAQPGRRAVLRSCSLPLLLGLAAAGRGGWRAAAAVESRTVQQGEDGAEGAADASSKLVLVVGGTGGVGQLVVASLLSRKIKTRLLLRNPEKAVTLFGKQDESVLQVYEADTRNVDAFSPEMFEGVTHVICTTGTTAFPSKRWDGDNTPERVGVGGKDNLGDPISGDRACFHAGSVDRMLKSSRCVVVTMHDLNWACFSPRNGSTSSRSFGCSASQHCSRRHALELLEDTEPPKMLPAPADQDVLSQLEDVSIMNLFGVLKYKKMAEDFIRDSGIPFTIIRPGRLTDGPYTSYDLNTLLKATAGERRAVEIGQGDKLVGEASRLVVAEACIQALDIESTQGQAYEISSVKVSMVLT